MCVRVIVCMSQVHDARPNARPSPFMASTIASLYSIVSTEPVDSSKKVKQTMGLIQHVYRAWLYKAPPLKVGSRISFFLRTSGGGGLRAHAASCEPGDSAIDFGHFGLVLDDIIPMER